MQYTINAEIFNAVHAWGRDTLKSAILINGGAGVALLAFMGQTEKASTTLATWLPWALLFRCGSLSRGLGNGRSLFCPREILF